MFASLHTKIMPVQSALKWIEFQEEKLQKSQRTALREATRPRVCPYCDDAGTMIGHGFIRRYIIVLQLMTVILLLPVFRCRSCGRTIRVLPEDVHNHCNHISDTIRTHVERKLRTGVYTRKSLVARQLQRYWYRSFKRRCQDLCSWDLSDGKINLLESLPHCSILYRKWYRTVIAGKKNRYNRNTHRNCPLIVCLDSS